MDHQNHPTRLVEADRFSDLVDNKLTVRFAIRGCEGFRTARDFDRVGVEHTQALEELPESGFEAIVEAPNDSGIGPICLARRIEMEDLFQSPSHLTPL
jgi:hypothetical protein